MPINDYQSCPEFAGALSPDEPGGALSAPGADPVASAWRIGHGPDPASVAIERAQRAEAADSGGATAIPGIPSSRTLEGALDLT